MNWRQHTVAILAARPTEWVKLCELFAEVEPEIPIHIAMRAQARGGKEPGIHTARWRLFLTHVGPLVARTSNSHGEPTYQPKRTDFVRLLPHDDRCECGGPRFLKAWPERGHKRQYVCPACQPAPPAPPPVVEEPVAVSPPAAPPCPIRQKPRLNAYQRRGNRPARRQNFHDVVKKAAPKKPQAQAPPPLPRMASTGIADSKVPITVSAHTESVIFENRRALASHLREFLGFKSINQADAELQRQHLLILLARHGRLALDFIRRVKSTIEMSRIIRLRATE